MTSTLSLPPELWRLILLTFHTPLLNCYDEKNAIHLWMQCRLVSKQFKHEIETLFISARLPNMLMYVDIVSCYDGINYCFYHLVNRPQTQFVGLTENKDLGIARVENEYCRGLLEPLGGLNGERKMPYQSAHIFRHGLHGAHSPAAIRDDLDIEFDWRALLTGSFTQEQPRFKACRHVSF